MKLAISVLTCALAGCAASQSGAPNTAAPQLEGTRWSLATATDSSGLIQALVGKPGKPVALSFEQGRIGISEACNRMGGQYVMTGNTLKVSALISTKMACEPLLMKAETEIAHQLEGNAQVEMAGEQLVLKTAQGGTLSFDRL